MKKIALLLLLVVAIPFTTIAQKRSKKDTKTTTNTKVKEEVAATFMIIKGIEMIINTQDMSEYEAIDIREAQALLFKQLQISESKLFVTYDVGNNIDKQMLELISDSRSLGSMAEAVNKAAKYGWSFINSTVIKEGNVVTHYYYMKR
jgi:hypothetical protein